MAQETISLELSSTGLRVASREESALGTAVVVVIAFIAVSRPRRARELRTLPA
jgi:hypothetical protein